MHHSPLSFLHSTFVAIGITLSLFASAAFAQDANNAQDANSAQDANNAALTNTPNDYAVSVGGAEIHLGTDPVQGDLILTGGNILLVLDPGEHEVTGNVVINSPGDMLRIDFNKYKEYGALKIGGNLILGPDNAPVLAIDLSRVVHFNVGESFVILEYSSIEGRFSGLSDGASFQMGDVELRINYTDTGIRITVVSVDRPWDRHHLSRTPIMEMDTSLINPTSTEPGGW